MAGLEKGRTAGLAEYAGIAIGAAATVAGALYYVGTSRNDALYSWFGVDSDVLDFPFQHIVSRGADVVVSAVLWLFFVVAPAWLVLHRAVSSRVRRLPLDSRRLKLLAPLTGMLAGLLLLLASAPLFLDAVPPQLAAIGLILAALVAEYGVKFAEHRRDRLRHRFRRGRLRRRRSSRRRRPYAPPLMTDGQAAARRLLVSAAILTGALWWAVVEGRQQGLEIATRIERELKAPYPSLTSHSNDAVVYSVTMLLPPPPDGRTEYMECERYAGVRVEDVGEVGHPLYRYSGLFVLDYGNGHWLLLPARWSSGRYCDVAAVIVRETDSALVRVDTYP